MAGPYAARVPGALTLELYNWYTIIGETSQLPALDRELRELLGDAAAGH